MAMVEGKKKACPLCNHHYHFTWEQWPLCNKDFHPLGALESTKLECEPPDTGSRRRMRADQMKCEFGQAERESEDNL